MPTGFLDDWFAPYESEVPLPYVGMRGDEGLNAAGAAGITDVRVIELPSEVALTLDLRSRRLNLLVVDGTVVRAAFF
jgi:hypothetical protein